MFGIGFFEICVIAVVALVFVGPQKLPELMRNLASFFVQMKRMGNEVKGSLDSALYEAETKAEKNRAEERKKESETPSQS